MLESLLQLLPPAVIAMRAAYQPGSGGYLIDGTLHYDCVEVPVADLLYVLAINARAVNIIETGTGGGFSTCHLAAAAKINGGVVTTYDPSPVREPLWDTSLPINAVATTLVAAPCDFAFLDSWHSYNNLMREVTSLLPLLKLGGLIVMHDTTFYGGLRDAVAEMHNWRGIELVELTTHRIHAPATRCPGLTILKRTAPVRIRYNPRSDGNDETL